MLVCGQHLKVRQLAHSTLVAAVVIQRLQDFIKCLEEVSQSPWALTANHPVPFASGTGEQCACVPVPLPLTVWIMEENIYF